MRNFSISNAPVAVPLAASRRLYVLMISCDGKVVAAIRSSYVDGVKLVW